MLVSFLYFFFFKQKTAYEMRISDWSSDVCSSDLLLAREVYERVVAIKGRNQVALITGEEKILPEGARYFLCTAESMPTDREVAFVAQIGRASCRERVCQYV